MTYPPSARSVVAAAAAGFIVIVLTAGNAPSTSVQFTTHVITDKLRGGYSVAIADVNHDGKLDIIPVAAGGTELAWYENPTWEKHVMLNDKQAMLWASPADIDGDGIPEFALLADFGQDPKTAKVPSGCSRARAIRRQCGSRILWMPFPPRIASLGPIWKATARRKSSWRRSSA